MYLFALKIKHLFILSCSLLITICYKYVSVIIRNISACCKSVTKNDATVNLPHWHFSMREISLISIFKSWQPCFQVTIVEPGTCKLDVTGWIFINCTVSLFAGFHLVLCDFAGSYCPSGTQHATEHLCPAGTYNNRTGANSEFDCLPCTGKITSVSCKDDTESS